MLIIADVIIGKIITVAHYLDHHELFLRRLSPKEYKAATKRKCAGYAGAK